MTKKKEPFIQIQNRKVNPEKTFSSRSLTTPKKSSPENSAEKKKDAKFQNKEEKDG